MRELPKVELHLHLDCSLSYKAVAQLDDSISLEEYRQEFIAPPRCTSLADFLTRAPRGFRLMQDEAALALVVEDLFEQLAQDNVIYAEIRFAPLLHLERGLTPAEVVAAVDRATEAAIAATGIEARIILCTLRHFSPEQGLDTARLVEQFRGSRVVALDIAGDEAGHPVDPHIPAFHHAIDQGLHRTAHAGEARGAGSVWETLREFQPARIGHGVRSIDDAALVEHLRREQIHLEVCPTSNVQTCICENFTDHAVDRLYRAGVPLSISTDTRTITNITLTDEYCNLQEHFGWTEADLLACNRAALDAAFIEDSTKRILRERLQRGYDAARTATAQ
ncbi:MAG TPA: adenosine deaminase [Bryobacteraceae bacterium]|nr:adenosine deaminase [Bryobacteraceae bacterium]